MHNPAMHMCGSIIQETGKVCTQDNLSVDMSTTCHLHLFEQVNISVLPLCSISPNKRMGMGSYDTSFDSFGEGSDSLLQLINPVPGGQNKG